MAYLPPGVHIERADATGVAPVELRTDVAAFIGIAERGPLDTPVPVESWRQFQAHFGSLTGAGYLAYAVRGFFDNGGARCWVVRVAARRFGDDGASGGARSAELLLHDAGGAPCWRIAASSPGAWGIALSLALRRDRPLTQRALKASASGAAVASVAGFAVGELLRLEQPAGAAYRVLARIDAASGWLYWVDPDPAMRTGQLAWTALDPARPLTIERVAYALTLSRRGDFVARYADLHPVFGHPRWIGAVLAPPYRSGLDLLRAPPPVTTEGLPQAPNLIQAQALGAGPPAFAPDVPLLLAGGADGLAGLAPDDFLGAAWDAQDGDIVRVRKARGLQALAAIDEIALLAIPDILIRPQPDPDYEVLAPPPGNPCLPCPPPPPPQRHHQPRLAIELPPLFTEAQILQVQCALVADCQARDDRFAVLSPPYLRATERSRGVRALAEWRRMLVEQAPARAAALYAPWLAVPERTGAPLPVAGSAAVVRLVPGCGHICGGIAATDLSWGVMRAPANIAIAGVVDTRAAVGAAQHGELNEAGVNVIRCAAGGEALLLGARSVSDDPSWRYLSTVRIVQTLKRAIDIALRWVVFEPNDDATRSDVAAVLTAILTMFFERGAFAGASAEESFYVRCDDDTTPQDQRDNGRLVALIGIAPAAPAEFIVLRVGRQDNLPVVTLLERGAVAAREGAFA
jgi:uncharacterized protein